MLASQLTKILNHLEQVEKLDSTFENSFLLSNEIESIKQKIKPALDQKLRDLYTAADSNRARILKLKNENRFNFFKAWEKSNSEIEAYKSIVEGIVSWQYPCLEIFPGMGQILPFALGAEPLYIADNSAYVLNEVAKQFNQYYADKRLMKFTFNGVDIANKLPENQTLDQDTLPANSFGLVYCVNYLHFEDIKNLVFLAENVYSLLLDGGYYLFSYNPLDQWWGVEGLENAYAYGADSNLLIENLKNIGYEIQEVFKESHALSYILAKKPGQLEHIKASSIIGKIIDRPPDLM